MSNTRDLIVLGALGIGAYVIFKKFRGFEMGEFVKEINPFVQSVRETQELFNTLKAREGVTEKDNSLFLSEVNSSGDNVTYKINKQDIQNLSPHQEVLLKRGDSITEISSSNFNTFVDGTFKRIFG